MAQDTVSLFAVDGTKKTITLDGGESYYISDQQGCMQVAQGDVAAMLALQGPANTPLFDTRPPGYYNSIPGLHGRG